jgi:hypothetical protein
LLIKSEFSKLLSILISPKANNFDRVEGVCGIGRLQRSPVEDAVLLEIRLGELKIISALDECPYASELSNLVMAFNLDSPSILDVDPNKGKGHRRPLPELILSSPAVRMIR